MNGAVNVVVPVKNPDGAKQRLAGVLSADQRRSLAVMLFEGVLDSLAEVADACRVLVVTDDARMAAIAERRGAAVLVEKVAEGETRAVERATAWTIERGFASQLVIPGDMARLDAADLRALLDAALPPPSVVLCPAVGDDGTNAILTSPPDALSYRFGARSFPEYRERAAERGIAYRVLRLPSLVLDLDTPEDLAAFLALPCVTPAHELLVSWNITSEAIDARVRAAIA